MLMPRHHVFNSKHFPARLAAVSAMLRAAVKPLHGVVDNNLVKRSQFPVWLQFCLTEELGPGTGIKVAKTLASVFAAERIPSKKPGSVSWTEPFQRTCQLFVDIKHDSRRFGTRFVVGWDDAVRNR